MRGAVHAVLAGTAAAGDLGLTVYEPQRRRYRFHVRPFRGEAAGALRWCWRTRASRPTSATPAACSRPASRTSCGRRWRACSRSSTRSALALRGAEARETIDQMRAEIDAMRQLIEDMLLLVRLQTGDASTRARRHRVTAAVDACVGRHAAARREHGMELDGPGQPRARRGHRAAAARRRARQPDRERDPPRRRGRARSSCGARGLSGAVEVMVPTPAPASPPSTWRGSSSASTASRTLARAPAPASAWRSSSTSPRSTAAAPPSMSTVGKGTTVRVVIPAPAAYRRRSRAPPRRRARRASRRGLARHRARTGSRRRSGSGCRCGSRAPVELLAQLAHAHVDGAVAVAVRHPPDPLLQLVAGERAARLAGQHVQQPELGAASGRRRAPSRIAGCRSVSITRPGASTRPASRPDGRHPRAAQHRLDPGDQLAHAERLGQVVVAADPQRRAPCRARCRGR